VSERQTNVGDGITRSLAKPAPLWLHRAPQPYRSRARNATRFSATRRRNGKGRFSKGAVWENRRSLNYDKRVPISLLHWNGPRKQTNCRCCWHCAS